MDPRDGSREVAQLAGARMPADHGLASLGLLMQLGGSVFLGSMVVFALLPLFAGGSDSLLLFLVGATAAVRSAFHRTAGTAMLYGSPHGIFRPTYTYVGVAVAQTALTLLICNRDGGVSLQLNLSLALVLLAWPITLVIMLTRPRLRALAADDVLPVSEDLGFEGAASLMVLLGLVGSLVPAFFLYTVIKGHDGLLVTSTEGMLIVGVFGMLLARSIVHTVAGIKGTRGIDSDGATEAASRYYTFGVVSSVIAGGAIFILSVPNGMHPLMLLFISVAVYLLLSWPLILRRFYTERNFAALLSGAEGPSHRRAPDAGMIAVGWLLLALGALQLAGALPAALLGGVDLSQAPLAVASTWAGDSAAALSPGERSTWWSVGMAMAQLWAGVELVYMTDRHRLAATIYGVIATVVTVYVMWPQLQHMERLLGAGAPGSLSRIAGYFQLALSLVVPIGTIALANRNLVPTARARVRASGPGDDGE
jgi:hypothetical protein